MNDKLKILIVDDKVENLIALEKLLSDFNVKFVRAFSGNEALVNTLLHDFALAIIDIQMPEMDGYETVELMRQEEKSKLLPVIFVSAIYKDDFYIIKGIETGAYDFISKPIVPEILRGKVKVFLDMCAQKRELERINAELKIAKNKAETETHTKSLFLASMSHEIRTPLNGIIGMVNIMKYTELTKEQEEYLNIIDISGNNLLSIINDILDFSKIESDQIDLEIITFNIYKEINDIIKLLSLKMKEKRLEMITEIHHSVPKFIKGDSLRLKQIIINLINNAIKFTPSGSITLKVNLFKQKNRKNGSRSKIIKLIFNVIDTGIGISEERKSRLFKVFSQTESSTSRIYGGTGLGLAISKNLSKMMHGEIGVESEEGVGSNFWFTAEFERSEGTSKEIEEKIESEYKTKNILNILLVEDNLINQKVAIFSLKKLGHNVDLAENGKIAFEKFKKNKYDLILMDVLMPVMDGVEATHKIREFEKNTHPHKRIKIFAMTAMALKGEREKLIAEGMDNYISKPFKPEELKAVLIKIL
jgi:two-component system, sensor histidine kinase